MIVFYFSAHLRFNLLQVAREELSRECDYVLEASNQKLFRNLLSEKQGLYVPLVVDELSSKRVLTTELIYGSYLILILQCFYVEYIVLLHEILVQHLTLVILR